MRTFLIFILSVFTVSAANLCVSVSSSGANDGTTWNDALGASFTPIRGNTYYLADGAYSSKTWNTAVSGATLITIKKATTTDHVTETGWSSTMGDGQAVWTGWSVTTPYWTFDGQAGGGPGSWVSGYGFKISNPSYSDGAHLLDSGGNNITDLTVQHTEMTFSNATDTASYGTAIYFASGITRLTLISNAVYQIPGDMAQWRSANSVIVDHCFFSENLSVSAKHGDVFEHDGTGADHTYRFNYFFNCVGTYCMSDQSGAGALSDVKIYGNIWEWTSAATARGFDNGLVATDSAGTGISGLRFFNNTIYGFSEHSGCHSGFYINAGASDNVVSNNIWYGFNDAGNNMDVGWTGVTTHDYNAFRYAGTQSEANSQALSADPFTSAAGHDFSLSANTTAGAALGSPYTTDIVGSTRTTWSRGAYEYGDDVTAPSVAITSQTNNQPSVLTSISVSGTSSDNITVASVTVTNVSTSTGFTVTGTTSWSTTVVLQQGTNIIQAIAADGNGNTATNSINIIAVNLSNSWSRSQSPYLGVQYLQTQNPASQHTLMRTVPATYVNLPITYAILTGGPYGGYPNGTNYYDAQYALNTSWNIILQFSDMPTNLIATYLPYLVNRYPCWMVIPLNENPDTSETSQIIKLYRAALPTVRMGGPSLYHMVNPPYIDALIASNAFQLLDSFIMHDYLAVPLNGVCTDGWWTNSYFHPSNTPTGYHPEWSVGNLQSRLEWMQTYTNLLRTDYLDTPKIMITEYGIYQNDIPDGAYAGELFRRMQIPVWVTANFAATNQCPFNNALYDGTGVGYFTESQQTFLLNIHSLRRGITSPVFKVGTLIIGL